MIVTMDPERTIYAAVETLLSLVAPEKAIYAKVTIDVTSKTDPNKSGSRAIHFLFDRPRGNYIAVYWACPKKQVFFPSEISKWTRSANNDGVQVVGGQGIGCPIHKVSEELLMELGGMDNRDYEAEASWLLGQPKPVKLRVTKLSKEHYGNRFKISVEE